MTESELLNKIKSNPAFFSELFKLYYKPIFGYVLRRTGDFDETADITAETFFKALKYINNFSYTGISVKVWLYRIATNEVNLFYRQKKRHNSIFERLKLDKELFSKYLNEDRKEYENELQKNDQFLMILKELKLLPVKYQEVISLKYFEGKDNKEIADILNIKEGTLKSLLSRGLEKLRKSATKFNF
jgi:RNA polymerase sigma-70 factor (ECF subfamily)